MLVTSYHLCPRPVFGGVCEGPLAVRGLGRTIPAPGLLLIVRSGRGRRRVAREAPGTSSTSSSQIAPAGTTGMRERLGQATPGAGHQQRVRRGHVFTGAAGASPSLPDRGCIRDACPPRGGLLRISREDQGRRTGRAQRTIATGRRRAGCAVHQSAGLGVLTSRRPEAPPWGLTWSAGPAARGRGTPAIIALLPGENFAKFFFDRHLGGDIFDGLSSGLGGGAPKQAGSGQAVGSAARFRYAAVAQPVERVLGKDEVMGPIPISSLASHHGSPGIGQPGRRGAVSGAR